MYIFTELTRWNEAEMIEVLFKDKKRQLKDSILRIQTLEHKKDKNDLDRFNQCREARWAVILEKQIEQLETVLYEKESKLYMALDEWEKEIA